MKKILISCFTVTFVFFIACQGNSAKKVNSSNANSTSSSAPAKKATGGPAMTFDKTSHDFGIISEGEKVTTTFGFTNTEQHFFLKIFLPKENQPLFYLPESINVGYFLNLQDFRPDDSILSH